MAPGRMMNSRELPAGAVLLAFLCLQAALLQGAPTSALLPPLGNSQALVTLTSNGSRTFGCSSSGEWELRTSSAALVSASDPSIVLGDFFAVVGDEASVTQWSLLNGEADRTESGQNYTYLSGKELSSVSTEEDQLYQVSSRNEPVLARYSFILAHRDDGAPPATTCAAGDTAQVLFRGSFTLYTQDQSPPPVDGLGLSVPKNENVYRSYFGTGTADWVKLKAGDAWSLQSASAVLSEVPGGPALGALAVAQLPDGRFRASWVIDEPNGWNVTAVSVKSVSVGPHDWPWQLYVNVQKGQERPSHVQFLSTKGGVPTSVLGAKTYSGDFLGVTWFYTAGGL